MFIDSMNSHSNSGQVYSKKKKEFWHICDSKFLKYIHVTISNILQLKTASIRKQLFLEFASKHPRFLVRIR